MTERQDYACRLVVAATLLWADSVHATAKAPARAGGESIAVLPLSIAGDLAPSWRAQLQSRLAEGVARSGRTVLTLDAEARCETSTCMREVEGIGDSRWVILARVVQHERDFEVALSLFDARTGERVTQTQASCEVCAVAEVGDMLADQAGILDGKLAALSRAPPVIRFESRPEGALVSVDGKLMGPAPLERTLDPGRHRARAELDGYLPLELQFDAVTGTRDAVQLELSVAPAVRRPMRRTGWAMLGLGLAFAGAGIPLVAVDGRPYRRRCSGSDVDADGDCKFRYDTLSGGAVTIAIGAAAIITGAVLLAVAARRGATRRRNASWRSAPPRGFAAHGSTSNAPMLGGSPQHRPRWSPRSPLAAMPAPAATLPAPIE